MKNSTILDTLNVHTFILIHICFAKKVIIEHVFNLWRYEIQKCMQFNST